MMQTFLNQTTSYTRFVPTIKINILWTQIQTSKSAVSSFNLTIYKSGNLQNLCKHCSILSLLNKLAQPKWAVIFCFVFLLLIENILIIISSSAKVILVKLYPQYASQRKVSVFEAVHIYLYIYVLVCCMSYNNFK